MRLEHFSRSILPCMQAFAAVQKAPKVAARCDMKCSNILGRTMSPALAAGALAPPSPATCWQQRADRGQSAIATESGAYRLGLCVLYLCQPSNSMYACKHSMLSILGAAATAAVNVGHEGHDTTEAANAGFMLSNFVEG